MKKYYADKNSLNFLRVVAFVLLICISFVLIYYLYCTKTSNSELYLQTNFAVYEIIVWILIAALITAYVVFLFIILPMWYRSVSYVITPDEIIISSGVIFRNTTYVKIASVQYTATVRCPLSNYTSFNFLLINAYGGRLVMMFLSSSDMEKINNKIQSYLKDRGGL